MFKHLFANLILLMSVTMASGQARPLALKIMPDHPLPGTKIELSYHVQAEFLNSRKTLKAAIYQYDTFKWIVDTMNLTGLGAVRKAAIPLFANCAFAAIKIYQGNLEAPEAEDTNSDRGYLIIPVDKSGKTIAGGKLAMALFYSPVNKGGVSGYFKKDQAHISLDSLRLLLSQELKNNTPQSYVRPYLQVLQSIYGSQYKSHLPSILDSLYSSGNMDERNLNELYRAYQFELRDTAAANRVRLDIISRYPEGEFARFDAYQQILATAGDNNAMISRSEAFLKRFNAARYRLVKEEQDYMTYGVYRNLATAYFDQGNFPAIQKMRKKWNFKTENEIYRWNIERALLRQSVPLDQLSPLADSLYKDLKAKLADRSYSGDFKDIQVSSENAVKQLMARTENQIYIHYRKGDLKNTLSIFDDLPRTALYANADLNEIHVDLIKKTGQNSKLRSLLENCMRANAMTPAMLEDLQTIFQKESNNQVSYQQYLASLKSTNEIEKLQSYVKEHLVSLDVQPFALEDINGNLVRSSDWGNKIIVLDFWATWCRPCIAAFPGMQMVVDKYAQDQAVALYFVGTMQFGDYKEKVKEFMQKEKWRFKILHDGINPVNGYQDAVFSGIAKLFNSSGIPRKIIMKDGMIRYSTEGYSGSPSQLVDELSYAIEILKAEK